MRKILTKISAIALSLMMTAGTLAMLPAANISASAAIQPDMSKTTISSTSKTKTTTKTASKKSTLKKKAKKTYSKKISDKTTTTSKVTARDAYTKTTVTTKTRVVITDYYKKNSKTKTRKTQTTVTTITTYSALEATSKLDAATSKKVGANVTKAFNDLGFRVKIDTVNFNTVSGYTNVRNRLVVIGGSTDVIYHELGHFVAFVAGNVDRSSEFVKIYNAEKGKYNKFNKAYVTQSSSEYFAECYKLYLLDNAWLKKTLPQSYKFVQQSIGKITTAQIAKIKKIYGLAWKD